VCLAPGAAGRTRSAVARRRLKRRGYSRFARRGWVGGSAPMGGHGHPSQRRQHDPENCLPPSAVFGSLSHAHAHPPPEGCGDRNLDSRPELKVRIHFAPAESRQRTRFLQSGSAGHAARVGYCEGADCSPRGEQPRAHFPTRSDHGPRYERSSHSRPSGRDCRGARPKTPDAKPVQPWQVVTSDSPAAAGNDIHPAAQAA